MTIRSLMAVFWPMCVTGLIVPIAAPACQAAETETIQVQFENSCAPTVAERFDRGITLLHSFEYPETPAFLGATARMQTRNGNGARLAEI